MESYIELESKEDIIKTMYEEVKKVVVDIDVKNDAAPTKIVNNIISESVRLAELVRVGGKALKGVDKKSLVLDIGKLVIIDVFAASPYMTTITLLYDALADDLIEMFVYVSKTVNTTIINNPPSSWCSTLRKFVSWFGI